MVIFVLAMLGCGGSLPESVPYRVIVSVPPAASAEGYDAHSRAQDDLMRMSGSEIVLDGQLLGRIEPAEGRSMKATFQLPSSHVPKDVKARISLRVDTICGPRALPLVGAPSLVDHFDESDLAQMIEDRGAIELPVEVTPPAASTVYVDWAGATPEVKVGGVVIPTDTKKGFGLVVADCADQPVTIDGAEVGTWKADAPSQLVAVDAATCYRWQQIVYGTAKNPRPDSFFRDANVHVVPGGAQYFLEEAPASLNVHSSISDERISQLTRVQCAEKGGSMREIYEAGFRIAPDGTVYKP